MSPNNNALNAASAILVTGLHHLRLTAALGSPNYGMEARFINTLYSAI